MFGFGIALLALLVAGTGVPAAEAADRSSSVVEAMRLETPAPNADGSTAEAIRVDGDLSDAAWQRAPVITGFLQRDPKDGAPATYQTEARVAYDASFMYIAVTALDPEPAKIVGQRTRRDERSPVRLDPGDDRFLPRQAERVRVRRQSRRRQAGPLLVQRRRIRRRAGTRCGTSSVARDAGRLARGVPHSVLAAPLPADRQRDLRPRRRRARSAVSTRPSTWPLLSKSATGYVSSFGELTGLHLDRSRPSGSSSCPYVVGEVTTQPVEAGNPLVHGARSECQRRPRSEVRAAPGPDADRRR